MSTVADFNLPGSEISDYASKMDRLWFEQHPGESERMRPPFPNEWVFDDAVCTGVQVIQVCPGVRARKPIILPKGTVQ